MACVGVPGVAGPSQKERLVPAGAVGRLLTASVNAKTGSCVSHAGAGRRSTSRAEDGSGAQDYFGATHRHGTLSWLLDVVTCSGPRVMVPVQPLEQQRRQSGRVRSPRSAPYPRAPALVAVYRRLQ